MLEQLKEDVFRANQRLVSSGLKAIAKMARLTEEIHAAKPAPGLVPYVGEKHYQRKHGKNAYYGQK